MLPKRCQSVRKLALSQVATCKSSVLVLFPFDGADGLGSQVHQNAVDAFHLVGDPVGDLVQDLVGDLLDGCGHGILGVDSADDSGPAFVTALVLNADTLDIGNCDEILPDLLAQTVFIELIVS